MNLKTPLAFACLLGGPFVSVGAVTFYRRALEWEYLNWIKMSEGHAWSMSWVGTGMVGFAFVILLLFRADNFGHWPWEDTK